ncbi:hypothetical protein N7460_001537 [Penicillium canescens]|uniref:Uncharacterized protein n=1 Tax=Penicillium canescens TaxID=5083 RepID=A0AAD6II61_PENCN|nr:hypothetical protein N7444_006838 [Penicillium canescens]KAJ6051003.1 hypothetical protein N7460_001537 [Penicillium canescens]
MAHHKPPQIDTYNGWRIATVDCRPKGTNCDLNGVRLWFNREGYYVIIGVPAEVCYALAVYGREATHVNKSWGNGWGVPHTAGAADAAGYRKDDSNIYYIFGSTLILGYSGENVVHTLRDMCERTEKGLKKEGHSGYDGFAKVMEDRIMEALYLHDPTWRDTVHKMWQRSREYGRR